MEIVVYIIVVIGFLYVLYSLASTLVKVKKAGRANCSFQMSPSKMFFRGMGVVLVTCTALVYKKVGNEGWLPFLCLVIINIIDFIVDCVEIKK